MFSHDRSGSRTSLDNVKKRSLYIFAALLALSAGYLLSSGGGAGPTGAVVGMPNTNGFTIDAKLTPPLPELYLRDVTLTLGLLDGGSLYLDGLSFSGIGKKTLVLTGYTGKVSTSPGGRITLNGKATGATLDAVGISKDGQVTVAATETPFVTLNLLQVSLESFELVSTGTVDVAGKGSFLVNNELVELTPFSGTIDIDPRGLLLSGYSETFNVQGERTVSVK